MRRGKPKCDLLWLREERRELNPVARALDHGRSEVDLTTGSQRVTLARQSSVAQRASAELCLAGGCSEWLREGGALQFYGSQL